MKTITVGSLFSGIEAASVAWNEPDFNFKWFAEIDKTASILLKKNYPAIPNLGDVSYVKQRLQKGEIPAPDIICGGTPCQPFSFAGLQKGLHDQRSDTLSTFVDIVDENDECRRIDGLEPTLILWENVQGILTNKTKAFSSFLSKITGLDVSSTDGWPKAGTLKGPKRNVAWRVLDSKYFGLPQQRKRIYLLAGGTHFYPENILFEPFLEWNRSVLYSKNPISFRKNGVHFQCFRDYTDCLYAAYGTKWNGNAAAYNGSLFIAQDECLRRFSPLECERLMGFPDHYTHMKNISPTNRYKVLGNSWAIPVIKWIGNRILGYRKLPFRKIEGTLNLSTSPNNPRLGNLSNIVSATHLQKNIYLSDKAKKGILRRSKGNINPSLEQYMSH